MDDCYHNPDWYGATLTRDRHGVTVEATCKACGAVGTCELQRKDMYHDASWRLRSA